MCFVVGTALWRKQSVQQLTGTETIKIFLACKRTINDFNSTVTVVDGPVTVSKKFYSFGLICFYDFMLYSRHRKSVWNFFSSCTNCDVCVSQCVLLPSPVYAVFIVLTH